MLISSFPLRISSVNVSKWPHLLKKSITENFIFCAGIYVNISDNATLKLQLMNYLTPKFIVFKKKISKKARFKLLFKARNRICGLRKLIVLLASPSNLSQILSISSIFHTLRSKLSD